MVALLDVPPLLGHQVPPTSQHLSTARAAYIYGSYIHTRHASPRRRGAWLACKIHGPSMDRIKQGGQATLPTSGWEA